VKVLDWKPVIKFVSLIAVFIILLVGVIASINYASQRIHNLTGELYVVIFGILILSIGGILIANIGYKHLF
jgi:hypothetical protein